MKAGRLNEGLGSAGQGGCFPIHLDSDETVDSRRVTAIVYLNRDWQKKRGGQLRLYPSWSQYVDIEPINDRLVLFSSCRMPHRYALTQMTHEKMLTDCAKSIAQVCPSPA